MQKFIQSYISNISFCKTIDEIIARYSEYSEYTTLDPILKDKSVEWTAPKWIKQDDIVFFMFSKTSIDIIHHLKKVFLQNIDNYANDEQKIIERALAEGEELYKEFGGSIFAIGRIDGSLIYDDFAFEGNFHWKGRIYAPINEIKILERPINISEFNSFILISRQSSITPLFGKNFDDLKNLILRYNKVLYLTDCKSCPLPLAKINNDNWFEVSNEYRRSFFLEYQFREFFVNYFLQEISDIKKIYKECPCVKKNAPTTYVDNLILFENKYLPVEVKLNIKTEKNLIQQCKQYCSVDKMYFTKVGEREVPLDKTYSSNVLIIDTEGVYLFSDKDNYIEELFYFDRIERKEKLILLKDTIVKTIKKI